MDKDMDKEPLTKPNGAFKASRQRMLRAIAITAVGSFAALGIPHDAYAGSSYKWNLSRIGVNKTLHKNAKKKGTNVKVGVLDGLARCPHKELDGRCSEWEIEGGTYRYWDNHGTHVATIIAASNTGKGGMVGVAPKAYVHSYGVFDDNGWVTGSEVVSVNHARKKGVRAINMSYGPTAKGVLSVNSSLNMMAKAANKNIVFVKAAGNDGVKLSNQQLNTNLQAWSKLKNLIIVGAVKSNRKIASFSNRPGTGCFKA